MGGISSKYKNIYRKDPELAEHECEFKALNISESTVGVLLQVYTDCKNVETGNFDVSRFLTRFKIEECGFAKYALTYYTTKRDLEIDFRPFVFALWNFCTLDKGSLVDYMFDLYDEDDSGDIDPEEAQKLLTDIYGEGFTKCYEILRAYNRFAMMVMQQVDLKTFRDFVQENEPILDLPLTMQKNLRARLLGERHWAAQTKFRHSTIGRQYRPVRQAVKASHKKPKATGGFKQVKEVKQKERDRDDCDEPKVRAQRSAPLLTSPPTPSGSTRAGGADKEVAELLEKARAAPSRGLQRALSSSNIGGPQMEASMTLRDVMGNTSRPLSHNTHQSESKPAEDRSHAGSRRNSGANLLGNSTRSQTYMMDNDKSESSPNIKSFTPRQPSSRRGSAANLSELTTENIATLRAQSDQLTSSQRVNIKVQHALKQDSSAPKATIESRRRSLPTLPAGGFS